MNHDEVAFYITAFEPRGVADLRTALRVPFLVAISLNRLLLSIFVAAPFFLTYADRHTDHYADPIAGCNARLNRPGERLVDLRGLRLETVRE